MHDTAIHSMILLRKIHFGPLGALPWTFRLCGLAIMSLARADTARTMISKAYSTSELVRGMEYVMCDSNGFPLPDNLDDLEDQVFRFMISFLTHLYFQELIL